jgi:perosamine synthetase
MLGLVHPIVGREEKKVLNEVIDSRILAAGKYVTEFENVCSKTFCAKHCVAVSNGTTALHAALLAAGIKEGDHVLTTAMSFIATANSILYCQAKPIFADIDPKTYNISPVAAEALLKKNKKIKAILLVHLFGTPCDMDAFLRLSKKYRVKLIEDCAQAHGATFNGKTVGTFGAASAFSFYATKNVMCGEGGIVLTNSATIDKLARSIINHGRSEHSTHNILGYNYRLTNLAAAIGVVQMGHLEKWNECRRSNAAYLTKHLSVLPFVSTPVIPENVTPVFHQYTIRVNSKIRERLMKHLQSKGVGCGIYYPVPMHLQQIYRKLGFKAGLCPVAEKAATEVLSIPVHPALKPADLKLIVDTFRTFKV